MINPIRLVLLVSLAVVLAGGAPAFAQSTPAGWDARRHPVVREHPRLLGSLAELRVLARQRVPEYQRMKRVALDEQADSYARIISAALVAAIEGDPALAAQVHQLAMKYVNGPIRQGHVPFATDLALCGIAYDLCYDAWPEADRQKFHAYLNRTVDANVASEPHVFHNGWYGYKHWGIGLACYSSYYENERAPAILRALEEDYRLRAAPALQLAGDGGGWAEDYFLHVLTVGDAGSAAVSTAAAGVSGDKIRLTLGNTRIEFATKTLGGVVNHHGRSQVLADRVQVTSP